MKKASEIGSRVKSACPNCGDAATRTVYDIGSGPELACASCEWCWGADGQPLKPIAYADTVRHLGYDPMDPDAFPFEPAVPQEEQKRARA